VFILANLLLIVKSLLLNRLSNILFYPLSFGNLMTPVYKYPSLNRINFTWFEILFNIILLTPYSFKFSKQNLKLVYTKTMI